MSYESRVGVRELRQHLSRYLRRVAEGEVLRVTERGRPVALLGPLPEEAGPVEHLRSQERLQAARHDLLSLGAPAERPVCLPISEALTAERAEE